MTSSSVDVDDVAHTVWTHASAPLCGSPTCVYADGERDADYENNCPHCKIAATQIATAIMALLSETAITALAATERPTYCPYDCSRCHEHCHEGRDEACPDHQHLYGDPE